MNYRKDKYGKDLSILGFGCMRFPRKKTGKTDMEETEREIMTAINSGVNYFDTAYIYPGSEAALGEILEKNNVRDKVYIATKLPHYLIKSREELDKKLDVLSDALEGVRFSIDQAPVKEALKMVVPTFREPDEINKTAEDSREMTVANS